MKKYLALIFTVLLMLGHVFAQPQIDDVQQGLKAGAVDNIIKYFDKVVDITIDDDQSTYSKSQAERVLKSFFSKVNIKSFLVKHKGSAASDNSLFVIGNLTTAHGMYTVFIFFKQKDNNYLIQQIRFEQK